MGNEADETESARNPADADAVSEEETAETAEVAQDVVEDSEAASGSESRSEPSSVEERSENVGQDDTAAQEGTDAETSGSDFKERHIWPETGVEQHEETVVQSVSANDTNVSDVRSAAFLRSSFALLCIAIAQCVV